jgi:hypothetical protein
MNMDSPDSESRLKSFLCKGGVYCLPIYISRKTRKTLAAEMAKSWAPTLCFSIATSHVIG